jgi:[acyl-carrier-protein] S-malonyltransferase
MSLALAEAYPVVHETFAQADALLGYALSELCFRGDESQLNDTLHTQPALFVAGVATYRLLLAQLGATLAPAFVAGHSLGEFTALVAGGALSFEDGLRLVRRRAELMKIAGEKAPGAVAAILGLEVEPLREVCARASAATGQVVVLANDNCAGQGVISGAELAVEHALTLATQAGAKRALRLAVSVAVHSPLMEGAALEFARVVDETPLQAPHTPLMANLSATPLTTSDEIRAELKAQLTGSVRWRESILAMSEKGVHTYLELGPSAVLVGLVKRISKDSTRYSLETPAELEALLALARA